MDMAKTSEREIVNYLTQLCWQSASRFLYTSEYIRNRGLSMVLKTYAQQRLRFGSELQLLFGKNQYTIHADEQTDSSVRRGRLDIRAGLPVQRQEQRRMLLRDLLEKDAQVSSQYAAALASNLATPISEVFERQYKQMLLVHERLQAMTQPGGSYLLVRLFENVEDAQKAIKIMVSAGVSENNISMNTVDNVDIYQEPNKQAGWLGHKTLLASGILGLLVGALLGGFYAISQQILYPGIIGNLIPTRFGAAFDIIGAGALIGASFALIVGSILGRDRAEDNNYLYETSLEKGNALVAVFADSTNRAVVEKSIGLRHEFEVRTATS